MCIDHIVTHPLVNRHLGYFNFQAVIKNAAIDVQLFFGVLVVIYFGYIPGGGTADHTVILCLIF